MRRLASALLITLVLAPAALADPPQVHRGATTTLTVDEAPPLETAAPEAKAQDGALDPAMLDELRGGEAIGYQRTTQTLTAVNSGNSVTGETIGSGAMNINANAFSGYDGIGNFVINTGHNNNLMGSVSVNVMVVPGQ